MVKSKFCYGLCNSFYVPGLRGSGAKLVECCAPTKTEVEEVELECFKKGGRGMRKKKVKVEKVLACGCQRAQ